ncbi:MAG: YdeI/OmpD-associated family protein [Ginsengibacter sp.]
MNKFTAKIEIIGINPFVFLPGKVLQNIFKEAGKDKGKIPVKIKMEGHEFIQTLIKYSGHWRLYLNTSMRRMAKKKVGDFAKFEIAFDKEERKIAMNPKLQTALNDHPEAKKVFENLRPSLRLEIVKYFSFLKQEETVEKNVTKAISFLLGKGKFVGRENP